MKPLKSSNQLSNNDCAVTGMTECPLIWLVGTCLLLAGCFGASPTDSNTVEDELVELAPSDVEGFEYECPPGWEINRSPGSCVGSLFDPLRSLFWPQAAVHPSDPRSIAMSIQRSPISGESLLALAQAPLVSDFMLVVSRDGGATWEDRTPKRTPEVSSGGEPVILQVVDVIILEHETLILAYEIRAGTQLTAPHSELRVVVSTDMGGQWGEPTLIGDRVGRMYEPKVIVDADWVTALYSWAPDIGDTDREYLLTWGRIEGDTWQETSRHTGIGRATGPAFAYGNIFFNEDGRLLQIDPVQDTLNEIGETPILGRLESFGTDGLFLLSITTLQLFGDRFVKDIIINWTTSNDKGATWAVPQDSLLLPDGTDYGEYIFHWRSHMIDSNGILHMIFERVEDSAVSGLPLFHEGREYVLWHFAVDLADGQLLHAARITPFDWMEDRRIPPSLGPDWSGANSYGSAGVAVAGERVFLAWEFDKGIDFTYAAPQR